ncbi:MAG: DNA recombination protein RmuC [Legionellales bacterium]|nr:DNA recombination protein RmuC [Legionellales bacterium]|tara:strand:- start:18694 stop:19965 length:1272 start_codon:yes stop_codon:yes gene_type:complete
MPNFTLITLGVTFVTLVIVSLQALRARQQNKQTKALLSSLEVLQTSLPNQLQQLSHQTTLTQTELNNKLETNLRQYIQTFRQDFDKHQLETLKTLQDSLTKTLTMIQSQITETLKFNNEQVGQQIIKLTNNTNERLKEISGQVEKRLTEGFEKTTATFADVVKRLALIDEAQKKITELSSNVVSLQEVLADKRSRGAFGEVQLTNLIRNLMPESNFSFQYSLSNGKRVDCMLFLPEPTGNIAVDAKFPLESYRLMTDINRGDAERKAAEQQFRQDIRKHISDIADKYIIAGETSEGAVMFIPAEAIFAEIHAHYPELIERAHKAKVWLVSPTTMMAILTTARAVLKDAATQKQVHIIQEHLGVLAKDFDRFQHRMDALAKHIDQAQEDVKNVNVSARKISSRFNKIEQVELALENNAISAEID